MQNKNIVKEENQKILGKFICLKEFGKFRLCTITKCHPAAPAKKKIKLQFYNLPISEGLAIEYNCGTSKKVNYLVLAFLRIDRYGNFDHYSSIGTRIEDYCSNLFKLLKFRKLLKIGIEVINTENYNAKKIATKKIK